MTWTGIGGSARKPICLIRVPTRSVVESTTGAVAVGGDVLQVLVAQGVVAPSAPLSGGEAPDAVSRNLPTPANNPIISSDTNRACRTT